MFINQNNQYVIIIVLNKKCITAYITFSQYYKKGTNLFLTFLQAFSDSALKSTGTSTEGEDLIKQATLVKEYSTRKFNFPVGSDILLYICFW